MVMVLIDWVRCVVLLKVLVHAQQHCGMHAYPCLATLIALTLRTTANKQIKRSILPRAKDYSCTGRQRDFATRVNLGMNIHSNGDVDCIAACGYN